MAIHSHDVMVLVTMSSVLALLYNLAHSLMMLHTSAGARTVAGEVKVVGLLVLSYFILGEQSACICSSCAALLPQAVLSVLMMCGDSQD